MSLQYLIDGYNVINQMELVNLKLEEQRHKFVKLIELRRPQGKRPNSVTVVFDGKLDVTGGQIPSEVKVVFSKVGSADDKIKAMVRDSENKKNIIVVTDDRDIQFAVKSEGAKVLGAKDFIKKLEGKPPERKNAVKGRIEPEIKKISRVQEHKINEELKDIWIKKDEG